VHHAACSDSIACVLTVSSNSFDNNSAGGNGGGLFSTHGQALQLQSNTFSINNAKYGPDISTSPAYLGLRPTNVLDDYEYAETSAIVQHLVPQEAKQFGADTMLLLTSNKEFDLTVLLLDYFGSRVGISNIGQLTQLADASLRLYDYDSAVSSTDSSNNSISTRGIGNSRAAGPMACSSAAGSGSSSSSSIAVSRSTLCAFVGWPSTQIGHANSLTHSDETARAGSTCAVGCLSGATTVSFKSSIANFSNIGLSSPPNSLLRLQITPHGLSSLPPLRVLIRVQPCGIGEVTNPKGSCDACPVPLINLIISNIGSNGSQTCSKCPAGASCLSGFPIPQPGFWHSLPRSTQMLPCTFKAACTPADPRRLVRWQRSLKYDAELPGIEDGRLQRYMKVRLECCLLFLSPSAG
jgi:predicted outer membrane repeat protein